MGQKLFERLVLGEHVQWWFLSVMGYICWTIEVRRCTKSSINRNLHLSGSGKMPTWDVLFCAGWNRKWSWLFMFDLAGKPSDVGSKCSLTHIHHGSLDYPFGGDETVQMYGKFVECPSKQVHCLVIVIEWPLYTHTHKSKLGCIEGFRNLLWLVQKGRIHHAWLYLIGGG